MDDYFVVLVIVASVLFVVLGLAAGYISVQGRRKAWADLAERLGLNFEPGSYIFSRPIVSGTHLHHQVKLDSFTRSSGRSSTTYTRIIVYLSSAANFSLTLTEEGVFSRIGKAIGMQDVQVGDDEIDRRYTIRSQPEDAARRVLFSLGMRQRLLEAPPLHIELRGMEVIYERRGFETDPNKLTALLDLMCALADAAERA
jgi:hypothetical protein